MGEISEIIRCHFKKMTDLSYQTQARGKWISKISGTRPMKYKG
jgi:hypothetical protein